MSVYVKFSAWAKIQALKPRQFNRDKFYFLSQVKTLTWPSLKQNVFSLNYLSINNLNGYLNLFET